MQDHIDKTQPQPPADDRPNRIPWPPILYVLAFAAAYVLEHSIPLSNMPRHGAWQLIGWAVFALGIGIGLAAILAFKAIGTPVDPTGRATQLVTTGIYAWTRNPMYLGAVIGFVGLSVALGSAWLLILGLLMPIALRKLAIDREEAYLTRHFGAAYEAYRLGVRRWL